ncbi:E3 ubiquitin-protein ligase XB3 isoform X1 [Selaginella moellendorffii]|uniref:E3 ubiquitin-protein ligase XB3 isoform X1 n=1 Tax=Selaginella moellendorffii TaxID=88036 RepID=UPI000D1CDE2C|nr:E3 ubiquitin-protein ligase XB3 isoform X1 [Selaginella moellendorffii]|eukprot:XP_024538729.1 E3 ubiquitin-protein ligase XB3 isoform X1 [Selaginella moellendorffii]
MGQSHGCGLSSWQLCAMLKDNGQRWRLYTAIVEGDCVAVEQSASMSPKLVTKALFFHSRLTPLHVAAMAGQVDVAALLIHKGASVNCSSCNGGQTPLMLASKSGKHDCVDYLIQHGANVLLFDTSHSRTCLHYAAKAGHVDCIHRILLAAKCAPVAESWKFVRFVNTRDSKGVTALHLAARGGSVRALQLLLDSGALVSATTSNTGNGSGHGSTPLHFAARGGSLETVQELLAWGADRSQRDVTGYTAYGIARKHNNASCAALLDPSVAEPLVWPSPCKFMNALDTNTRSLLEKVLEQANQARGRAHRKSATESEIVNAIMTDDDQQLEQDKKGSTDSCCCICFEHRCNIELHKCGHQMCASCILTLCCHNKPNPAIPFSPPPGCPFCRTPIERITLVSQVAY